MTAILFILSFVFFIGQGSQLAAQTAFTTSGTYTVPAGTTAIKIECWGAGGGGSSTSSNNRGGGGGGGGAYASSIFNVSSSSYSVVVGTGGGGSSAGGSSSFNTSTVVAVGGGGGTTNANTPGAGGTAGASTGTTKYSGGTGGTGSSNNYSGGGGGAAGSTGAGGNSIGSGVGLGTTLNGGNGAAGITSIGNGVTGGNYGGGGSGEYGNGGSNVGGSGANGYVLVTVINTIEVNATIGTALTYYTTLKGAFDAINAGTHQGVITIKINGSSTETASAALNASGAGSASYTSVTIYPTATSLSISASLITPLIQLNGADNVTIDGRVNQTGSANLVISNSSTAAGARTIEFINSAQNNYIQYCTISGAGSTNTQGMVNFSTASSGTGNDGNYIQYCNLTGVTSANRPVNAIYSAGTLGSENSENIIRNNNIYDHLMPGTASNGIYISSNSTAFTISGNSFYESASFVPTASVEYAAIRIDNTSGNDYAVLNNFIGGRSASCGGTAWTKTNAFNNTFNAIYLNIGTTNNSVQGNSIQNFSYANSGAANWYGVYLAGGIANVGTTTGNIIGSATGTGSIVFTGGATGAAFNGIYIASTNTITCSNNTIGSINTAASAATNATNFYGIYKSASAGTTTLSNNTIGSTSTSNSVKTRSAATANSQILYGIYSLGTGAVTISNNEVANLTDSTTETALASRVRGIFANDGTNTISGNHVSKLITGGLSGGNNYDNASLVGISVITTLTNQTISDNTVNNLETTATGKIEIYGIYYNGPNSGTNTILRNFVYTFIVPAGGDTGSYLHGISMYAGDYTAANNIVYLGSNITVGCSIWGLWNGSTNDIKIYHNTIYLSGTATAGTSNSYAFRSLNCPSTTDIRNNILWDGRTNSSGTISHYAVYLNCTTNLTLDYNDYQYAQQFGIAAGTTYNTFAAWKTAFNVTPTFNEAHSLNVDPLLANLGGTLPVDYQTNTQLQGVSGTGITTDYNGVARITPTMGAWEYFSNPVEIWNGSTYRNAYTTLKGAFDVINAGTYTGDLIIKFRGNTTETASAVLNASGAGSASYTHILIYPARSGVTVTGNLATPLVDLNSADKVTFDGRVNGTGSSYEFTFINSSTSNTSATSTFRFINSAENDTIRYCVIKGSSTATTGGDVYFATATSGNGNDGNVILSNKITSVSSSYRPINAICSVGSSLYENSGVIIQNNDIFDFFNPANDSYGINIGANSTAFTISGNSFFETTSFSPAASVIYNVININNTSGNSFIVSGNYIGGNATACSGTWTKINGFSNLFYGININVGTTTASSVQGNVVKNITYSNTGAPDWAGMYIAGGLVNVGTSSGNTIGASTGTGSIAVTNTTSGGNVYGINIASTNNVDCENNVIGSITSTNAAANATNLYGINKTATAGTTTISNNIIGSTTTVNSINASGTSTGNAQVVYGISSAGTGAITISNNTIVNINNATNNATATTYGRINGILVSAGSTNTVSGNLIHDLSIANANTFNGLTGSVVGIALSSSTPTRTISNNTIYSLTNTFSNYAGAVIGLYYEGSTSGTNTVSRNFIHSLNTPNAGLSTGAQLYGILIATGVTTFSNNIINLGNSYYNVVTGIYDLGSASQNCNMYFNTVYIGGTNGTSTQNSYALYVYGASNARDYRNNIFANYRTRSGGSGSHYAIYYLTAGATNLTVNYNDYYAPNTGGVIGYYPATARTTLSALQSATGQDANSQITSPGFNVLGSTSAIDYKIASTLVGINGTGVTIDYGLNARPGANPTMGAWETNSNKWVGTYSTDWNTATNWSGNVVPATDATIEFYPTPLNHCVMDQDRSVTNIVNAQSTYRVVTNGHKLTIKGDLLFSGGAQIDATSSSSTVEFAGASAQSIPTGSFYTNGIYNLSINNANNVTLNGTLRLLNTITATSGRLDAYTHSPAVTYAGSVSQSLEDARYLTNKVYDLTIDNAVGVNLNTDFTVSNNLTINSGKLLTISVANQMLVQGTVTNSAGASGLIIKTSSVAANGSFIFYNSSGNPVAATVEMYSKAFAGVYDPSTGAYSKFKWQYFGIPVSTVDINPTMAGSYVRYWDESGTTIANHWIQMYEGNISPFIGYEITQPIARTVTFTGNLVNSNYSSGQFPYTPTALYPGQQVLANPYAAAIDIRQLSFGSQMEWTVYLYNCGSYNDWYTIGGDVNSGVNPGQYTSVPISLAGYSGIPRQIPSMQGFLVKALSSSANATLSIPYSSTIMKNTDRQRAPKTITNLAETTMGSTFIEINGSRFSDKLWIFSNANCSRDFDNGWDGEKNDRTSSLVPLIYCSEASGDYQIDAVNDINNTEIGFFKGEDSIYTMTFTHENMEVLYPTIYLHDLQKDTTIDVSESGTQYTFLTKKTDTIVNRFKIVTSQGVATEKKSINDNKELKILSSDHSVFVHNFKSEKGELFLYDISGKLVLKRPFVPSGITTITLDLPIGVYVAKALTGATEVVTRLILK
jgi:hypothetical protein